MLHPKFISLSVDDWLIANIGDSDYLQDQRQFCIQCHFGNVHIEASEASVLSVYFGSKYLYFRVGDAAYAFPKKYELKPKIAFEPFCNDPFLYLICIHDGLYYNDQRSRSFLIIRTFPYCT